MQIARIKSYLFLMFMISAFHTFAQQKGKSGLKKPVLISYWGNTKGGNLSLDKALELVDSSIIVTNDKKEKMQVARFFIHYKSLDNFEDEKTGNILQRYNSDGEYIRESNILTEYWRKYIYESLKRGDEIIITELYIRDKEGFLFLAPDIKISVK